MSLLHFPSSHQKKSLLFYLTTQLRYKESTLKKILSCDSCIVCQSNPVALQYLLRFILHQSKHLVHPLVLSLSLNIQYALQNQVKRLSIPSQIYKYCF